MNGDKREDAAMASCPVCGATSGDETCWDGERYGNAEAGCPLYAERRRWAEPVRANYVVVVRDRETVLSVLGPRETKMQAEAIKDTIRLPLGYEASIHEVRQPDVADMHLGPGDANGS